MIFGKHMNRYYRKHLGALLLGLLALVAVDWMQLKIPNLYQMVINGVTEGTVLYRGQTVAFDLDFLLDRICLPMAFIVLGMIVGRFLWRICLFGAAVKMEDDLRRRMFDRCRRLSRSYYEVNKVGSLMSLFTNDLETVRECFGDGFIFFFDALFLGVLAVAKMWRMDPLLTGLSLIPMAFLLLAATIIGKTMTKKWAARQEAFSNLSDFSQESFSGIAVVKAFVKEAKELLAFRRLNKENEDTNVAYAKASVLLRITVVLFVESVICVILGYGGWLVHEAKFNAGQLVEFIGYFTSIVWPVMAVSELIDMTSRGKASLQRISELLDAETEVRDAPGVTPLGQVRGKIEFRDLTFRHPGGEFDALKGLSFTILPGQSVGLVGATGSGKTTVADVLLRIYNVPDGTVFLDDRDVNTIPIRDVREAIACVPQDNFLFSDTILRNIGFAADEVTQEQAAAAAEMADVDENIRGFAQGYETVLGERGVTVSGGQKQRISIARALLKDAPVLILDDAVSAVDTGTEKRILENLRASRAGKTTILTAHRVSTIRRMDLILFLQEGRLLAAGTHDELYETCAEYRRVVDLQKLEEEGGGDHA